MEVDTINPPARVLPMGSTVHAGREAPHREVIVVTREDSSVRGVGIVHIQLRIKDPTGSTSDRNWSTMHLYGSDDGMAGTSSEHSLTLILIASPAADVGSTIWSIRPSSVDCNLIHLDTVTAVMAVDAADFRRDVV